LGQHVRRHPGGASGASLEGYDAAGKNFKIHLDGYNQRDLLARKGPDKRREFFYGPTTATLPAFATTSGRQSS
jgi:hypothetical protein